MTKQVRVENACTSNFKVVVQTWDKGQNGEPDKLAHEELLGHPTAMTNPSTFITSTRYLVVKEVEQSAATAAAGG